MVIFYAVFQLAPRIVTASTMIARPLHVLRLGVTLDSIKAKNDAVKTCVRKSEKDLRIEIEYKDADDARPRTALVSMGKKT